LGCFGRRADDSVAWGSGRFVPINRFQHLQHAAESFVCHDTQTSKKLTATKHCVNVKPPREGLRLVAKIRSVPTMGCARIADVIRPPALSGRRVNCHYPSTQGWTWRTAHWLAGSGTALQSQACRSDSGGIGDGVRVPMLHLDSALPWPRRFRARDGRQKTGDAMLQVGPEVRLRAGSTCWFD